MRTTLSLNGSWQIAESVDSREPGTYSRTVPVPGLVSLAQPPFPGTRAVERPPLKGDERHRPVLDPLRDYFWYRREFELDTVPPRIRLRVAKAQFGLKVWINGSESGEHHPCFSSALLDITSHARAGKNEIVFRIGAHPGVLPPEVPCGSDQEKQIWIPGVYDDVALWLSGDPAIASVEVAADLQGSRAKLRATIQNSGLKAVGFRPLAVVRESKTQAEVARWEGERVTLEPGEKQSCQASIQIPNPRLWSPDAPFLYMLELSTGGDSQSVRFGMRELRFDTPTRRAYLNDKLLFLRGSNITLHRFFEDIQCGTLPWDPQWVRRLLQEWPRKLGWNCFRFSIGPVPEFWFDIADEAGLILENEYFIWLRRGSWSSETIKEHVSLWMLDCANHPSVGWWSLSNETWSVDLDAMISELRQKDLSGRAWNNGYYLPEGPDDPIDDHHYLYYHMPGLDGVQWTLDQFIRTTGPKSVNSPRPSSHATILNEYGWLWLLRDGQPTLLTKETYALLLPSDATNDDRIRLCAELHSHETRYFRVHRNYAGVLHFTFLTAGHPNAYTGDLWMDVARLEMWPEYEEAFSNAFQPVCAHLHYVRLRKKSGDSEFVPVAVINDEGRTVDGEIVARIVDSEGKTFSQYQRPWSLPAWGQHTWFLHPEFPTAVGHYRVQVEIRWDSSRKATCFSRLEITHAEDVKTS